MEAPNPIFLLFCVVAGPLALAYWAYAMFTDRGHRASDDPEEVINSVPAPETPGNHGAPTFSSKNSTALRVPSVGVILVFVPLFTVVSAVDARIDSSSFLSRLNALIGLAVALSGLLGLIGVIVGMTPISLPRWMYPEWQRARRALRRRERAQEEAAGGYDPGTGIYYNPSERKRNRARAKDAIPWPPPSWARTTKWWQP